MTAHVALLRGINVGGRAQVAMSALRAMFVDAGCSDVRTYIQSGNVVFGCRGSARPAVTAVAARLHAELDLDVTVIVRTAKQMDTIVGANPFGGPSQDLTKVHVTFLAQPPEKTRLATTRKKAFPPDEFQLAGSEVYVYCPNGYGKTKVNNTFFERSLGVAATTRNWNTVTTLARLANGG